MHRLDSWGRALVLALGLVAPSRVAQSQAPSDSAARAAGMWAAQTSARTLQLAWDHLPGPTSYVVACVIGRRTTPRVIGNIGAPSTAAKDASSPPTRLFSTVPVDEPGAPYRCFLEWGRDAKGAVNRLAFNEVVPVVPANATKAVPTAVTARATAVGEMTVTWNAVPGATAYIIGRAAGSDGFRMHCNLCPARTTFVDRYAKPGAAHTYSVAAMTASGAGPRATSNTLVAPGTESAIAAQADAGVTPVLKAPSGVTAAVTGATSALVTWSSVPGAVAYEVLRSLNGGSLTPVGRVQASGARMVEYPDYLAGGAGTRASYAVKSVDSAGNATVATPSNEITIVAKAATPAGGSATQPTNLRAALTGPDAVTLTWRPPGNAIPCTVRRRTGGSGTYASLRALAIGVSQYVDTMSGLAGMRPQYQLACGDPKSAAVVAFPNPI